LSGFSRVVLRITSCTLAGVIVGVLPGRGASLSSAAKPPSRNRFRQRAAFSGVIFNFAAIC
jgi:TctA family transporter